ncbi:MAG TPA: hypothetical protein VHZ33_27635 [Trebonia sp.]|jgi:hypothetical protein|nr:hypothetical protein [Trebonia sp.]
MSTSKRKRRLAVFAVVVGGYVAGTIVATRAGYRVGRNSFVRCRQGHLFTTTWIPGGSLKAIRLGLWRIQWCPVGRHVDLVRLVKEAGLSAAERASALRHHDIQVP